MVPVGALRVAVPTNLQRRKDPFRLKFRGPSKRDKPRPSAEPGGMEEEDSQWREDAIRDAGARFSSSQPCALLDLLLGYRNRACTSGFQMTRAAEMRRQVTSRPVALL